jgi:arginine decarboxylase-like protein
MRFYEKVGIEDIVKMAHLFLDSQIAELKTEIEKLNERLQLYAKSESIRIITYMILFSVKRR